MTDANSPAVLLLTHTADHYTVDRVADALRRRGARPFRFDTDQFPRRVRLSSRAGSGGETYLLTDEGKTLEAAEVRGVWARKLWTPQLDEDLDEQFRVMCRRESGAALEGFLDGLSSARWVNDLQRGREAENKQRQLRLASASGLRVPRTLVTNDPEEARSFFRELDGRVVAKLLTPLSISMGQAPVFVYTSEVREEDLREAEALRHSPMVFQERVEKERELRVAWAGGRAFVGAIDARGSERGRTDWRRAEPGECAWLDDELPPDVAARLDDLMSRLGLAFGAIDLIRTPEGEHVFLEVNASGEWGMLERDLGLPISEAIADALLK